MCGAFSVIHPFKDLSQRFNAGYNDFYEKPRFNVRPSQPVPVILNSDPSQIVFASWGIHPTYDKTRKMFFINARNDSLLKPTWKKLLQYNRCLIPADGFYEWQRTAGSKIKIPFRFELKDKGLFAFAGLWQEELDSQGNNIPHCVIITTEPNAIVSDVHDRMPAILAADDEQVWLNPDSDLDQVLNLVKPYPEEQMLKYPISTLVNSPANDDVEIIAPVDSTASGSNSG
jgi:putative SOS response-associated peptidase YedK